MAGVLSKGEGAMGIVKTKRALVVGCGEFGLAVADKLSSLGCAVTVVDTDAAAFNGLPASFGGETLVGDGADVSTLEACEIDRASYFVACTTRDSVNYFIARVASEVYGVEHVYARIDDGDLVAMLEDSTIEPICPHALCLGAFCRIANLPLDQRTPRAMSESRGGWTGGRSVCGFGWKRES